MDLLDPNANVTKENLNVYIVNINTYTYIKTSVHYFFLSLLFRDPVFKI